MFALQSLHTRHFIQTLRALSLFGSCGRFFVYIVNVCDFFVEAFFIKPVSTSSGSIGATACISWHLFNQAGAMQILVNCRKSGTRRQLFPNDHCRIGITKTHSLLGFQIDRRFQSLLRKPKSVDIFGREQQFIQAGILGGHQFQQAQHCHAVITIREKGRVVTTRAVYQSRSFLDQGLLMRIESNQRLAGK